MRQKNIIIAAIVLCFISYYIYFNLSSDQNPININKKFRSDKLYCCPKVYLYNPADILDRARKITSM